MPPSMFPTVRDWAQCLRSRLPRFSRFPLSSQVWSTVQPAATALSSPDIDSAQTIPADSSARHATSGNGCSANGRDFGPSMRSHEPCTPCTTPAATRGAHRESDPPRGQRYNNAHNRCRRIGRSTPTPTAMTITRLVQRPTGSLRRSDGRPPTVHIAVQPAAIVRLS